MATALVNPSDFAAVQAYPHLRRLLVVQLDMQFADLRGLLRLPLKKAGIGAGCNLTVAALLFNIISGSSVLFYRSSMKALKDQSGRGQRFKELLSGYYLFEDDDLPRAEAPTVLYEAARNPLAHALAGCVHRVDLDESDAAVTAQMRRPGGHPLPVDGCLVGELARPMHRSIAVHASEKPAAGRLAELRLRRAE